MESGGNGASVLVVDDEKEVADAYALKLRQRYDVDTAYSGEEALSAVDDDVDVVLLDRRMPEQSGDDVLAEIRDRGADVRVVLLTAIDPDFDIIGMPFDDYVCKPISDEDLYGAVEQQLRIEAFERLGEYFQLEAKRALLRAQLPRAELDTNEEYRRLDERVTSLREEIAAAVGDFEELAAGFDAIDRATQ